jgi:hypothetical protein
MTVRSQRTKLLALPLAIGALLAVGVGSAQAVSSAVAITALNKQRIANGIPGGVRSVGSLAGGCAKHNAYMKRNGGVLTHFETKGRPSYSVAGEKAGRSSVLSYGGPAWRSLGSNPWETAPIHLAQLLAPSLAVSGYSEANGFACAQTLASPRRQVPSATTVYTYPGDGASIYPSERAAEGPYTPGELIGIRGITGPYLYVMADGPDGYGLLAAQVTKASLTDAGGHPVPVATADGTNPKLRGYIPPGGFVIPTTPLRRGTTYSAAVTLAVGTERLEHSWSFETGG